MDWLFGLLGFLLVGCILLCIDRGMAWMGFVLMLPTWFCLAVFSASDMVPPAGEGE